LPFLLIDLQADKNLLDRLVPTDNADEPHLARTLRTGERFDLPHLLDACPPNSDGMRFGLELSTSITRLSAPSLAESASPGVRRLFELLLEDTKADG